MLNLLLRRGKDRGKECATDPSVGRAYEKKKMVALECI